MIDLDLYADLLDAGWPDDAALVAALDGRAQRGDGMNAYTPDAEPEVPAGFVEVTKDQFFDALKADHRDIMPTTESPNCSWWRVVWTREAWGWTGQAQP
jgi:hypothetical protein